MLDAQTLLDCNVAVSAFYDAALGETGWTSALAECSSVMNATASAISMRDPVTRRAHFSFGNIGASQEYIQSFPKLSQISPFVVATAVSAVGEVINPIDVIGRKEYEAGRFYKEWSQPQGMVDYIGAVLDRQPNAVYTITIGRTEPKPLFDQRDVEILQFLVPHVTRAIHISGRLRTLEAEKRDLLLSIDSLAAPLVLLDGNRRIRQMNAAAEAVLKSAKVFAEAHGTLQFKEHHIETGLAQAAKAENGLAFCLESQANEGLRVHMLPLKDKSVTGQDDRLLIVLDQSGGNSDAWGTYVVKKYGFTLAELRVFMRLLDGRSVAEMAEDFGLSVSTIRTHIAHLLAKTGTNRQSELVRVAFSDLPNGMPVFKTTEIEKLLEARD